jgi:hypothetical protein
MYCCDFRETSGDFRHSSCEFEIVKNKADLLSENVVSVESQCPL